MEDFAPFEIAKKLKEKGFKEPCFGWYYPSEICGYDYRTLIVFNRSEYRGDRYKDLLIFHDDKYIDAPTISQVLKWLREEKKIHIGFLFNKDDYYATWIQPMESNNGIHVIHDCKSYENAAFEGIEFVLDNLI